MSALKELHEYHQFMGKAEMHKSINTLAGLLNGIAIDETINASELDEIKNWLELHKPLMDRHPFNEIVPAIEVALCDGTLDTEEVNDILWLCNRLLHSSDFSEYYNATTSSIQELEGILHGIMADNQISDVEITNLESWMDDNDYLRGTYPFDEIYSLIVSAKSDGKISDDERNMLQAFFATFIDTRESYNVNEFEVKRIQGKYSIGGICAVCPEIAIVGKTFCFTGASKRATRQEIADQIAQKGGVFNNNVTKDTDYLIVGADGNPCWAFSCYGRKVEKAIELRKAGQTIILVHEFDFWDEF